MKKILLMICASFLLSGCVSILTSELPEQTEQELTIPDKFEKRDITFSISYFQEIDTPGSTIIVDPKDIKEKIKERFKETGLFRKIKYVDIKDASEYHFHFDVVVSGPNALEQIGPALLTGYTLLIIPAYYDFGIDISMRLFIKGKETYSIGAPQQVKDVIWLPFFFTWPFLNHGTTGHFAEKNAVNFFANEIIKKELYLKK